MLSYTIEWQGISLLAERDSGNCVSYWQWTLQGKGLLSLQWWHKSKHFSMPVLRESFCGRCNEDIDTTIFSWLKELEKLYHDTPPRKYCRLADHPFTSIQTLSFQLVLHTHDWWFFYWCFDSVGNARICDQDSGPNEGKSTFRMARRSCHHGPGNRLVSHFSILALFQWQLGFHNVVVCGCVWDNCWQAVIECRLRMSMGVLNGSSGMEASGMFNGQRTWPLALMLVYHGLCANRGTPLKTS